jgi:hypothetical protein
LITVQIDFIEIALTVFLTVFFQSLFTHMVMTRAIMKDIQRREQLRQLTEKEANR